MALAHPSARQVANERYNFDREDVLGTRYHIELAMESGKAASKVEEAVQGEIERLDKILSGYNAASEWRRAVAATSPVPGSKELVEVLRLCELWSQASKGAFEPNVGVLVDLWKRADQSEVAPVAAEIAAAVAPAAPLLDGVAKGDILDLACAVIKSGGCDVGILSIGGDVRVFSESAEVRVADPLSPAGNAVALCELRLNGAAVATSAGYARGFDVGDTHHSHIIDPRTGKPADAIAQAAVVALDAATADALATILCVLPPKRGSRSWPQRQALSAL